jgi:hypothetical protein
LLKQLVKTKDWAAYLGKHKQQSETRQSCWKLNIRLSPANKSVADHSSRKHGANPMYDFRIYNYNAGAEVD